MADSAQNLPDEQHLNRPDRHCRLFLALWPGPAVLRDLLACRDGWIWNATASLVRPEQLHLTLHFLGDVQRGRLPGLIHGHTVPFNSFDLRLGRAEVWPNGVAVLQPSAVPDRLARLHAALQVALRDMALPVGASAFRPHVTLSRRAGGANPLQGFRVLACRQLHPGRVAARGTARVSGCIGTREPA